MKRACLALCLFLSATARAAPVAELGVGAGAALVGDAQATGATATGPAIQLDLSVALHERVSIAASLLGSTWRGAAGFAGTGRQGDLSALTPALSVRVNALGFDDALGAKRLWLYARAGAGWSILWPAGQPTSGGLYLFAALGIEYRAHLKGFALGLEVAPSWHPQRRVFGGSVIPHLQFSF